MNKSDIPISVILEQTSRYTPSQMKLLYEDNIDLNKYNANQIKILYRKAEGLHDETTLKIITDKYDMFSIFEDDLSGLPNVSVDDTEKSFEEIYEFIKSINPKCDMKLINKRNKRIEKITKKKREHRRYGSSIFRTCYKTNGNKVIFSMKSYLYKTTPANVYKIADMLECPTKVKASIFPEIVDWILIQKDVKETIVIFLRKMPDRCPIPLEDVVDMENGKITLTELPINQIYGDFIK